MLGIQNVFAAKKYKPPKKVLYKYKMHIISNSTLEEPTTTTIPFSNKKNFSYVFYKSTESTCECDIKPYIYEPSGLISCFIPGGYRVQATVKCKLHNKKENSLNLYMCKNLSFWCEK